jgi:hypothetical protein
MNKRLAVFGSEGGQKIIRTRISSCSGQDWHAGTGVRKLIKEKTRTASVTKVIKGDSAETHKEVEA